MGGRPAMRNHHILPPARRLTGVWNAALRHCSGVRSSALRLCCGVVPRPEALRLTLRHSCALRGVGSDAFSRRGVSSNPFRVDGVSLSGRPSSKEMPELYHSRSTCELSSSTGVSRSKSFTLTLSFFFSGKTSVTLPLKPLKRPSMTLTVSPTM